MTRNFDEAQAAYENFFPESPFFTTWVPREKFLSAEYDHDGNFTISREDDGIYGIALGQSPVIPENWRSFSLESRGISSLPEGFKALAEWDSYWSPTATGDLGELTLAGDEEIDRFLREHAPDSSVFPGNKEIERWVEIRLDGELVAVAALCRWESGRVVISSVATHQDLRGRGLGKQLIRKCLIVGEKIGESFLSLGVRHGNQSAQRLYQSSGFRLMHNFTYCERR